MRETDPEAHRKADRQLAVSCHCSQRALQAAYKPPGSLANRTPSAEGQCIWMQAEQQAQVPGLQAQLRTIARQSPARQLSQGQQSRLVQYMLGLLQGADVR